MSKLLTREEFKESVFKRDGNKCVMCMMPAVDAHHLMERKLFPDGGYYLDNGVSLCSEHHLEAEKCDITVEELRTAAGIKQIVLPPDLKSDVVYDKWGQEVDEGMISRKYGRTYHFDFSPGTTSDDRISTNYWEYVSKMKQFVISEKCDGENNCLSEYGVFARSHAAPTTSRWTQDIRQRWQSMKYDLKGGIQIFLENLYAIHSIEYKNLDSHYHVFAVRQNGLCLSWEEVQFWAAAFDFPTVPVLEIMEPAKLSQQEFVNKVLVHTSKQSDYKSFDVNTNPEKECLMEGIVGSNYDEYLLKHFDRNVYKYVRAKHVKTDAHWTLNWKRAELNWEKQKV